MSPYLAWGNMSIRQLYQRTLIKRKEQGWQRTANGLSSRLHWHCHFIQRLETEPSMEFQPLNSAYQSVLYTDSSTLLSAWCEGKTGFPLVDACMRCLNAIGFLNFRMRAFVVSFAVFGLHLDWRAIHPHLARVFYDYEPGIHLAQLQMQAGIVGINTIRVYSPTKQLIDQDPNCTFVKKWIPELRNYSTSDIQSYENFPFKNYPKPIIDFKQQSILMKDQIFSIRKRTSTKISSKKVFDKHGSKKTYNRKRKEKSPQIELF